MSSCQAIVHLMMVKKSKYENVKRFWVNICNINCKSELDDLNSFVRIILVYNYIVFDVLKYFSLLGFMYPDTAT